MAPSAVAAHQWLRRRNVDDERWLVAGPLVALGLLGYIAFYAFLASPLLGRIFSFVLPLAALFLALRWRSSPSRVGGQHSLHLHGLLALFVGLFYLGILFLPELGQAYIDQSAFRFLHRLPFDPVIPAEIGNRLFENESLQPFMLDWRSSDRPPLQAGLYLLVLPWLKLVQLPPGLGYQCVGTLLQLFWIPSAWLICRSLDQSRRSAVASILIVATVGFFVANSVYVWPKLLAAAFVIFAGLILLGRHIPTGGSLLAGASLALGFLSHGSAAFSILALFPLLVPWRSRWKIFAATLLVSAVLVAPWTAYQKFYDPPGDRLLKWHLAGVIDLDNRSFGRSFRDAYQAITWHDWLHAKTENVATLLKGSFTDIANVFTSVSKKRRSEEFFYLVRALGVLNLAAIVGLIGWLRHFRNIKTDVVRSRLLGWSIITIGIWIAAMFLPGSTVLHHGSYATMLVFCTLAATTMLRLPRVLAIVLTVWHSCYFVATWLLYFGAAPVNFGMVFLMILATGGVVFAAFVARKLDSADTDSDPTINAQHLARAPKHREATKA
jgi:hypothetical protein